MSESFGYRLLGIKRFYFFDILFFVDFFQFILNVGLKFIYNVKIEW